MDMSDCKAEGREREMSGDNGAVVRNNRTGNADPNDADATF